MRRPKRHPFAIDTTPRPDRRWQVIGVIVVAALIFSGGVAYYSRYWMAGQLASGLEQMPSDRQHARLALLIDLGEPA